MAINKISHLYHINENCKIKIESLKFKAKADTGMACLSLHREKKIIKKERKNQGKKTEIKLILSSGELLLPLLYLPLTCCSSGKLQSVRLMRLLE